MKYCRKRVSPTIYLTKLNFKSKKLWDIFVDNILSNILLHTLSLTNIESRA